MTETATTHERPPTTFDVSFDVTRVRNRTTGEASVLYRGVRVLLMRTTVLTDLGEYPMRESLLDAIERRGDFPAFVARQHAWQYPEGKGEAP